MQGRLSFLCAALLNEIYPLMKFQVDTSNTFWDMLRTKMWNRQTDEGQTDRDYFYIPRRLFGRGYKLLKLLGRLYAERFSIRKITTTSIITSVTKRCQHQAHHFKSPLFINWRKNTINSIKSISTGIMMEQSMHKM
jgi:hypothetical protein